MNDGMTAPTGAELRDAMALVPTAVTVVTAPGPDAPAGATANAVASLSLDPPLMLVCLDRASRTLEAVRSAGRFAVNVLGAGSEQHARAFASTAPHAEKWEGIGHVQRAGVPVLDEAIVWVACELRDLLDGGDHVIVTGSVTALEQRGGEALLFTAGTYRTL